MILFYFEKAYDRIEWPFVLGMLEDFGFPSEFCGWVSILFKGSSAIIGVNGELSDPFQL